METDVNLATAAGTQTAPNGTSIPAPIIVLPPAPSPLISYFSDPERVNSSVRAPGPFIGSGLAPDLAAFFGSTPHYEDRSPFAHLLAAATSSPHCRLPTRQEWRLEMGDERHRYKDPGWRVCMNTGKFILPPPFDSCAPPSRPVRRKHCDGDPTQKEMFLISEAERWKLRVQFKRRLPDTRELIALWHAQTATHMQLRLLVFQSLELFDTPILTTAPRFSPPTGASRQPMRGDSPRYDTQSFSHRSHATGRAPLNESPATTAEKHTNSGPNLHSHTTPETVNEHDPIFFAIVRHAKVLVRSVLRNCYVTSKDSPTKLQLLITFWRLQWEIYRSLERQEIISEMLDEIQAEHDTRELLTSYHPGILSSNTTRRSNGLLTPDVLENPKSQYHLECSSGTGSHSGSDSGCSWETVEDESPLSYDEHRYWQEKHRQREQDRKTLRRTLFDRRYPKPQSKERLPLDSNPTNFNPDAFTQARVQDFKNKVISTATSIIKAHEEYKDFHQGNTPAARHETLIGTHPPIQDTPMKTHKKPHQEDTQYGVFDRG
jgi:hypothetical protein